MFDKRKLHLISVSTLVALILSFLFTNGERIAAAVMMAIICAATCIFVKKRGIPSYNKGEVAFLMAIIAALVVMIFYFTGLKFGFYKTIYGLRVDVILKYVLPIVVVIVATEITRSIICMQESLLASVVSYFAFIVAEVLIHYSLSQIFNFDRFMDVIGMVLLPAVISNLLYHYLAKRYGAVPNILYRLITTLYVYIIPYQSRIPDSMVSFARLLLPIAIFLFVDYLYEKKKRYALSKKGKLSAVLSVIAVVIMTALIMLVSNSFQFGAYVIATESMTGELDKGDIAIYEEYDDQTIVEGQVIVFERNGNQVIHRVVEIENINGQNRYYTKGDANDDRDAGYVTKNEISGIVELKVPYLGYPTIWLRQFMSKVL